MSTERYPDLLNDTPEEHGKWIREVTRVRASDVSDHDKVVKDIEDVSGASNAAADVTYSNATSGLVADDVQAAIDEVEGITDSQGIAITAIQAITSVISGKYCIGQIQTASLTSTLSTASTSMTNATGLQVTLTPGSTSSIILLFAGGSCGASAATVQHLFDIANGSTPIQAPTTPSSRKPCMISKQNITATQVDNFFLHGTNSPGSTSAQTYNVMHSVDSGTGLINRSNSDTDSASFVRGTSFLMAIELRPIP